MAATPLVRHIKERYWYDYFNLLQYALNKNQYTAEDLYKYMYDECLIQEPDASIRSWTTFGIIKQILNEKTKYDVDIVLDCDIEYLSNREGSWICKKNDKEIYLREFYEILLTYEKITNSYRRLYFHLPFNNMILADDIINKIIFFI